jgi:hypothetical protein
MHKTQKAIAGVLSIVALVGVANAEVTKAEQLEAAAAAKSASLVGPFTLRRVPAAQIVSSFDLESLSTSERAELAALDARSSPLCGRGDGSPMTPCPIRRGAEFGVLIAKHGGCIWSPRLGIPSEAGAKEPVIGVAAIRCSATASEWQRIQRTALPR